MNEAARAYAAAQLEGDAWQHSLDRTDQGAIKPTLKNCFLMLKFGLNGLGFLAFNEFLGEVVMTSEPPWGGEPGPWTDTDDLRARLRLGSLFAVDYRTEIIAAAVQLVADERRVHPVRDYLRGLEWDGTSRVFTWLEKYLGAATFLDPESQRYLGAVGSMWLIGAVARVMRPGCKMDTVLILEGMQGKGKSSALRVLAGEWFSDTPFALGDKDSFQSLRGKWIVELAELDALNKAEATRAKAFFSSAVDNFRPSYGRRTLDHPRQAVFAGTTNADEYLRDSSGNRRYWPVLCTHIDIDALTQDRDQLWAETVALYDEGVEWWPRAEFREAFDRQQQLREISDPWEAIIARWLAEPDVALLARGGGIATGDVLSDCLKVEAARLDERAMQMRVARCLRSCGLIRVQVRSRAGRAARRHVYRYPDEEPPQDEESGSGSVSHDDF